jgi:GDP-L-fucose synthase
MNVLFGASGLAGSGITRALNNQFETFLVPRRTEVDLYNYDHVEQFLQENRPKTLVMAAGVVGGIKENIAKQDYFLLSNLKMNLNVLQASLKLEIPKVLVISSSCIYPSNATQPLQTIDFLKGSPEPTNSGHAIGKTTASWLIKFYRESYGVNWGTLISSSLYGLEDDFTGRGHVIPGLIKRFANSGDAPVEKIWGSPDTLREFLFNDDLGEAVKRVLELGDLPELINVGSGEEISMGNLSQIISTKFNYGGKIEFDSSVPAGWPRRILNSAKIREIGWAPKISLDSGLERVIRHYREAFLSIQ